MKYYSTSEVTQMLGITRQTLTSWIDRGVVEVLERKINGKTSYFFDASEIEAYLPKVRSVVDIDKNIKALREELKEIEREYTEKKRLLKGRIETLDKNARYNRFVGSCVQEFLSYLHEKGEISDKQYNVVKEHINGYGLSVLSKKYNMTMEGVRAIFKRVVFKAIRKMRTIDELKENYDKTVMENGVLKNEVERLRKEVHRLSLDEEDRRKETFAFLGTKAYQIFLDQNASVKICRYLKNLDCTMEELARMTRRDFLAMRGLGHVSINQMEKILNGFGLRLNMKECELQNYEAKRNF